MLKLDTDAALQNTMWNALTGRQAHLARGNDLAKWYDPDFTHLAGVKEENSACYHALRDQMASGHWVVVRTKQAWPAGFDEGFEPAMVFPGLQMVCPKLTLEPKALEKIQQIELVKLDTSDVPEMVALAELTKPGPFGTRTIEFGNFYGIKHGGKLVAMAGQRMMCGDRYDEVSGVCTHPDFAGRGYGRALVVKVAQLIFDLDHVPFLHVRADNTGAIGLYESIGFTLKEPVQFAVLKKL